MARHHLLCQSVVGDDMYDCVVVYCCCVVLCHVSVSRVVVCHGMVYHDVPCIVAYVIVRDVLLCHASCFRTDELMLSDVLCYEMVTV